MLRRFRTLFRGKEGQDLLEYSLLASLIALGCVASITYAGTAVQTVFNDITVVIASIPVL